MTALDLAVCPICRAKYSLVRQTTKFEGRSQISYVCIECESVLLWLGDDLWLEADRWAYQKIGIEDKADLLHRSLTVDELRDLANQQPSEDGADRKTTGASGRSSWGPTALVVDVAPDTSSVPDAVGMPDDAGIPEAYGVPEVFDEPVLSGAARDSAGDAFGQETTGWHDEGTAHRAGDVWAGTPTSRRRRSRGSPFLVISVILTILFMVCAASIMIVSTNTGGKATEVAQPTDVGRLGTGATDQPAPTETLAPTETPVPTETPTPAPTAVPAAAFQGVSAYVADTGTHYVVGEVLNRTEGNLRFVEILASFYDGGGQLIGTGSTFAELSIIEPGGLAPFKLATLDPPPSVEDYELRSDYVTTDESPVGLEVLSHSSHKSEGGWYYVVGEVKNPHGFVVKFPEIVATFYNATHDVVRVEVAFSQLETLQPEEVSPFEIILVDPPDDLQHYVLQTEAVPE